MIARILYYLSFVAIAATVTIVGIRMWNDAQQRRPRDVVAIAIAPDSWIELASNRRKIARVPSRTLAAKMRWSVTAPADVESLVVDAPLVLALSAAQLTAFDLDSGAARFTWALPLNEAWGPQRPVVLGACFVVITQRGGDANVRCLDPQTGVARWVATIAGGRGCTQPPLAVRGAYIVQCEGWTSVIDDRTGAATVDAGGLGIVQLEPPFLLRSSPVLAVAPWFEGERRFAKAGDQVPGTTDFIGRSAVRRWDRLIVRASSASDALAVVSPNFGNPVVITSAELHLADDTPLVLACGSETSPRFQLVDLAPKLTAKFDPDVAQQRAFGLLDVVQAQLAWTSRTFVPVHGHVTAHAPLCVGEHYFVPLELRQPDGEIESALWIVDAETGKTTAVDAFDPASGHSFGDLTLDQVDSHRLVGIGPTGAFALDWRAEASSVGMHDARADVERTLGPLP